MQQLSYDGVYPCAKTSLQCTHARAAKTCHRVLTLGRIGMDAQIIVLDAIWTKAASKGQSVGSLNASAWQRGKEQAGERDVHGIPVKI